MIHFSTYEDGALRIYEDGKLIAEIKRDLLPALILEAAQALRQSAAK